MPLLDHFHGRMEVELPWSTMAQVWAVALMRWLNQTLPRDQYQALTEIRAGSQVEADVAEYRTDESTDPAHGGNGAVGTLTAAPPAVLTVPATFPDEAEIEVRERRAGRPLVGVIELVSPGNEDRPESRHTFVAKCAAYLSRGIGLVVIDVVTERHANLHNDLLDLIGKPETPRLADCPTYVAGYRPVHRRATHANEIEVWPYPAVVGQLIPSVPFGLRGGPTVVLDLEATYTSAIESTGL